MEDRVLSFKYCSQYVTTLGLSFEHRYFKNVTFLAVMLAFITTSRSSPLLISISKHYTQKNHFTHFGLGANFGVKISDF